MGEEKKPICCSEFILWDKKQCCKSCHSLSELPFRLRFDGVDCEMCCNAASWVSQAWKVKETLRIPE